MTGELQQLLWPHGSGREIWAIVDAAQDQQVYWSVSNSFLPNSCLFAGALPQALEMAAPYLVQLDPDDKLTDYLAANLDRNMGIFLRCDASLPELRRHLRRFLTVKDPAGRRMLFRYYDPRVMRVYLPTCQTTELETVFGPVTSYWTAGAEPGTLEQFEFRGKQLRVTAQTLGTRDGAGAGMAAIVPAQKVLTVAGEAAQRHRVPVLLQGAGRGGVLRRSAPAVRFYRTVTAAEELPFTGDAWTIPAMPLEPDVTVYAEAAAAGEVTVTLAAAQGGTATARMTAVALRMETGEGPVYVGTAGARRRVDVLPPEPSTFSGSLTVRAAAGGPGLTLYTSETGTDGYSLTEGYTFEAPRGRRSFWLSGERASASLDDAGIELLVSEGAGIGDSRPVTVVSMGGVTVEIPGTPPKARRLPLASPIQATSESPVVLLTGAAERARAVGLRADITPAQAGVRWTLWRAEDDGEAVIRVSPQALPGLEQTAEMATLTTEATGTFRVRAAAGRADGWGGPAAELEIVLVHASLGENRSSVNGRLCACGRVAGTDKFRLHSGPRPAVQLEATVTLVGGGPEGQRGLESIRGGWINNIVSDSAGARYRGGTAASGDYRYVAGGEEKTVDFADGPMLDGSTGRCMAGGDPAGVGTARAGEAVLICGHASPATEWSVQDGAAPDRAIEQIWRYLQCRSYLALWTAQAPEQIGVLLETAWSFTGDYGCNATRTTRTTVPARLASTGTVVYPALVPGAQTAIEVHPPASGVS